MSMTKTPVDNGINLEALVAAREALTAQPELAPTEWRASCTWVNGTHSHSTVEGYTALGEAQSHKEEFHYDVDHPELFASEDKGVTPIEYVLVGLAGCLAAGIASVAQMREIQLHTVTATVTGNVNLLGIMGIDPEVRNGFEQVNVHFAIEADASPEDIEAVVAQSQKRSAVYDIMSNPTNITVTVN